MPVFPLIQVPP
jgi:hypothetical protein